MVLQAFMDESYSGDTYVLAGCIATEENWAKFSAEWEKLLPKFGVLHKKEDIYHLHMREMSEDTRNKVVPIFLSTIDKYVEGFIHIRMNVSDIERARERIFVPRMIINWEESKDPNYYVFRCLLDMFHSHRGKLDECFGDEKIDFYFDENTKKPLIISAWEYHKKHRKEGIAKYFGATPRFENDIEFLPLQAADLLAWWFRKSYEQGKPEKIRRLDFAGYKKLKMLKFFIEIQYSQDHIIAELVKSVRKITDDGDIIYVLPRHGWWKL